MKYISPMDRQLVNKPKLESPKRNSVLTWLKIRIGSRYNSVKSQPYFYKLKPLIFVGIFGLVGGIGLFITQAAAPDTGAEWKTADKALSEGLIESPVQTLEVTFKYDQDSNPVLAIDKITRKKGYVPKVEQNSANWKLEVVDVNQEVIDSMYLDIPLDLHILPPPSDGEIIAEEKPERRTKVDFAVTLGWSEQGVGLVLRDPGNQVVAKKTLDKIPKEENSPKFRSIHGKDVLKRPKQSLLKSIFPSPKAYAQGGNVLDVTFIGDDYSASQAGKFRADVDRATSHLLTYSPFYGRAAQIVFHYVDNTSNLDCYQTGRRVICDPSLVTQNINSAGVPYDTVVVLFNSDELGGSAYRGGIAYVSTNLEYGAQAMVHEFGHSLAELHDEYILVPENGSIDGKVDFNCYAGTPPAAKWSGRVALGDYRLGCTHPNWYRSSSTSIMKEYAIPYFNAVSQDIINQKLDFYTSPNAPPFDTCTVPNAVSLTSTKDQPGYWLVNSAGEVTSCEQLSLLGDISDIPHAPVVGIAATPSGNGYWIATSDGAVYAIGDAVYDGGANTINLNAPIVGIKAHPTNGGYWLVGADGGVFAFGGAPFKGSAVGINLNQPVMGMVSSPSGDGYWLYASDGGVFSYGDAKYHGSTGDRPLPSPIVTMAATDDGKGYWLVARDGGIYNKGNAVFMGSTLRYDILGPIIGVLAQSRDGYTTYSANGLQYRYGTMKNLPSTPPTFKTTMSYNNAWPMQVNPTNITATYNNSWPQQLDPTNVQMNWYTAWDGGVLPGHCAHIFESNEPWEYTWMDNQLCSNIDLGLTYTSAWPAGQPVPGNCVTMSEPADPSTWNDNVICTSRVDIGLRWSNNGNQSNANTTCVSMNESSDPHGSGTWADNYLCWNTYWPRTVNAPAPAGCISLNETAEPWEHTWHDNVLCMSPDLGLSWNTAHPNPGSLNPNCVAINEIRDPHSWQDNVLCSSNPTVQLRWSAEGIINDANLACVNIHESSDPHYWADNYLCWNKYSAQTLTPLGPGCVSLAESADPENWWNNVLCANPDVGLTYSTNTSPDQPISPNCVRIFEREDRDETWEDNVLCSSTYIGLDWSQDGSLDDDDTNCVQVTEPAEAADQSWDNNFLCWHDPALPDLIVTDLTWTPAAPQTGNQVTFSATIKNIGTGATPEGVVHGVAFRVDGTQVSASVGHSASLAPGASRTQVADFGQITHTWTATGGSHTIEATVDGVNFITNELNETNNKFSKTLITNVPPGAPPTFRATSVTYNSVALAWDASYDDRAIKEYRIYRNGNHRATIPHPQLTYTDTGLVASTPYTYQVSAIDNDGAESTKSQLSVTTLPVTDNQAPNAPVNLGATPISATQVNLSWNVPADNPATGASGVKGYRVYQSVGTTPPPTTGTPVMTLTTSGRYLSLTTLGHSRLALNTTYTYSVVAYDAGGYTSPAANVTVRTYDRKQLSNLVYSAINGYGPVERDSSNGGSAFNDGLPLTLNGTTYRKGLGAHSYSEITYAASNNCGKFTASVGVDDEVGTNGSVIFQVWTDGGVKRYDSGIMTGSTETRQVDLNIKGVQQLKLIITNAGDNNFSDHGDWANPILDCNY